MEEVKNGKDIEYLYHYTSIEKLALILKNKTIRLSPLDLMDDPQEQKTADVNNLGRFVFISSWTADTVESIPMWKMYTNPSAGVRIKMRKNPFLFHGTYGPEIAKTLSVDLLDDKSQADYIHTFLNLSKMIQNGYFSPQGWSGDILNPVIYTDDIKKLEPEVLNIKDNKIHLSLGELGKYKNIHWSFQKEWRYIMIFMSVNFQAGVSEAMKQFTLSANRMCLGTEPPPFRYFDLDIALDAFSEMEITASPQLAAGNRILLEALIEKYNPSAKLSESSLLGLL